jgi:hypothetical protein
LHRRLTYLKKERVINLVDYAEQSNQAKNAVLNKAKRQTIPAFREQGQWKIGVSDSNSILVKKAA